MLSGQGHCIFCVEECGNVWGGKGRRLIVLWRTRRTGGVMGKLWSILSNMRGGVGDAFDTKHSPKVSCICSVNGLDSIGWAYLPES